MKKQIFRTCKGLYRGLLALLIFLQAASAAPGSLQKQPDSIETQGNIPYATVDGKDLLLDLYRPAEVNEPLPLIVWIHGGAWRYGDKRPCRAKILTRDGFAVASINYRLTDRAIFPAQIHDCKGAIRFLRSRASEFGINPDAVGVWGDSAGGHLAALVGTSGGVKDLEGDVGGNLEYSSDVQAVCDWYGPTNFMIFADPDEFDPQRHPVVEALFGGPVNQKKHLARAASPITHIDKKDPPFLIMHGDKDPIVPLEQSELFYSRLKRAKVPAELIVVEGAGHGFPDNRQIEQVRDFFVKHLKKTQEEP